MAKDKLVVPVVKWVGGKRQLLGAITPLLPKRISSYCEPFLGGGAILFSVQPKNAIVNDLNTALISVYEIIRDDVETLISILSRHVNTQEHYYSTRDLDRDKENFRILSKATKAARLIFLNKTCYNGLFRVNSAGEFNTPFGYYKNPGIVNEPVLRAVSEYLSSNNITFYSEDFADTLRRITKDYFVYLDPPYDPVSDTASFTGYNKGGFDKNEQIRLKQCCDDLNGRGIKFLLSNSATTFIKDLYRDYHISVVEAKRVINSDAKKRGVTPEVLIRNYGIK